MSILTTYHGTLTNPRAQSYDNLTVELATPVSRDCMRKEVSNLYGEESEYIHFLIELPVLRPREKDEVLGGYGSMACTHRREDKPCRKMQFGAFIASEGFAAEREFFIGVERLIFSICRTGVRTRVIILYVVGSNEASEL